MCLQSQIRRTVHTWHTRLRSLQTRTARSHFMSASFTQRTHGELEGASGHVLSAILHAHRVHAHLTGHEADAVGVVAHGDDLGSFRAPRRAGDLSRDVMDVDF